MITRRSSCRSRWKASSEALEALRWRLRISVHQLTVTLLDEIQILLGDLGVIRDAEYWHDLAEALYEAAYWEQMAVELYYGGLAMKAGELEHFLQLEAKLLRHQDDWEH